MEVSETAKLDMVTAKLDIVTAELEGASQQSPQQHDHGSEAAWLVLTYQSEIDGDFTSGPPPHSPQCPEVIAAWMCPSPAGV